MRRTQILLVGGLLVLVSAFTVLAGGPEFRTTSELGNGRMDAPPEISLHRTELNFGAVLSGNHTGAQAFIISNSGGGDLNWSASASEPWIECTPPSGTGEFSVPVWVGVDPTGLGAGLYAGTVTISDPAAINSPVAVDISLDVHESDTLPFGQFNTPVNQSHTNNMIPVTGWVLDDVEVLSVVIYREEGAELVPLGDVAFVEGARPDVQTAYPGYPNNDRAGWAYALNTLLLPNGGNGEFQLHALARESTGREVSLGTKTIYNDNANASKPFGDIDAPARGGVASGSEFLVSGWVLTHLPNTIPTDGSTIRAYVDGVLVGNPVYDQYREDVATQMPGLNNSSEAGMAFTLGTNAYANGIHTVQLVASDDVGNIDGIGSRYFTIINPPIAPVPAIYLLPIIR